MAVSLAAKFEDLKAATLEQWRGWAESMAAGGASPTPVAVLDAGALLEIPSPMAALEADAKAIVEAAALEAQIEANVASDQERLEQFGGTVESMRARIEQLKNELRAAHNAMMSHGYSAGLQRGELGRLRAKHPRVFAEPVATAKKKAKT